MGFPLSAYLARIGVDRVKSTLKANLPTLALVMASQSRAIAFENLSVVQRETISIDPADIINKLIDCGRGGYCFEQNMLLQDALREIGFEVVPLLCRVRWNKTADQETPFTHMALKVKLDDGRKYLADVGFGGTNSIAPLQLGKDSEPQQQPEGLFRTITDSAGFNTLQWEIKGEWRALYMFNAEQTCLFSDLEQSNWWSCTYPKARFTTSLFVSRVIGEERHHILDSTYVARRADGTADTVVIADLGQLTGLLTTVFGLKITNSAGLDRYLKRE